MKRAIAWVALVIMSAFPAAFSRADTVYVVGQVVHGKTFDYVVNRVWWQEPSMLGVDITITGTLNQARIMPFVLVNGQGRKVSQVAGKASQGFANAAGIQMSVVAGEKIRDNVYFQVGPSMQWDLFDVASMGMNVVPRVAVVR